MWLRGQARMTASLTPRTAGCDDREAGHPECVEGFKHMRHLSLLASLALAGLIAVGACGDNNSSGSGGRGGSMASAGGVKGGTGGVAGAAGGHVGSTGGRSGAGGVTGCTNVPSCLQFLVTCAPSGTCVSQTSITISPPSGTYSRCYSNGVKQATTAPLNSTSTATTGTTTVSLNGTFCYAYDVPLGGGGVGGGTSSLAFKNAAGAVLATVVAANSATTTFSCGGQTYQLPTSCTAAVGAAATSTACAAGTCP